MSLLRSLISKELVQHRGIMLWLLLFTIISTLLQVRLLEYGGSLLSYLTINSLFCMPGLVIIGWILCHHMMTAEYYGTSQRFTEALPVRRGTVELVRYIVGFTAILIITFSVWLWTRLLTEQNEPISTRFALLMISRLTAYVFTLWGFLFLLSLLGKFRIPLVALTAGMLALLDLYTSFELNKFATLALIDADLFSSERFQIPWMDLAVSITLGFAFLFLSLILSRFRDGSFIETLAVPMGVREKGFLFVLVVTGTGIFTYHDREEADPDIAITPRLALSQKLSTVAYLDHAYLPDATNLSVYLEQQLEAFDQTFGLPSKQFHVWVSLNPAVEAAEYGIDLSSKSQGILTTANFEQSSRWSNSFFGAFIFHQILVEQSHGRVLMEQNHWFADGFAQWWAQHGSAARIGETTPSDDQTVEPLILEALYAHQLEPFSEHQLRHWEQTADRFGDAISLSIAYFGWRIIEQTTSRDAVIRLAKQEYERPVHLDIRDWWNDWINPMDERFEEATSLNWETFLSTWQSQLEEMSLLPQYHAALADLPRATFSVEPGILDNIRRIDIRLTLDLPLPADNKCVLIHSPLPPYDIPMPRQGLRETELFWPLNTAGEPALTLNHALIGEYGSGNRVYVAIECDLPGLPSPIRLGVSRVALP